MSRAEARECVQAAKNETAALDWSPTTRDGPPSTVAAKPAPATATSSEDNTKIAKHGSRAARHADGSRLRPKGHRMRDPPGSPADLPGASAPADICRRTFLGAVGAAGIVAATARMLPAKADATPRCFFGSNADVFLDIRQGVRMPGLERSGAVPPRVPGLTGVRIYGEKPDSNGNNKLARHWPAGPSPTDQGPIVYSIYPMPDTVINPDNPAHSATIRTIRNIIDTAPAGSYLTAWHEALSLPSSTPPGATPAMMKPLHKVLNGMCQKSANVTYGSIFGGNANFLAYQGNMLPAACPPRANVPLAWDSVPDDLGFYGIDVYGGDDIDTNMCFLDTFITNANLKADSGYPMILIAETNKNDTDAKRVEWFEQVATRMQAYGPNAVGILTFWGGADAALSGAWNPADSTVINGMNYVINSILV